MQKYQKFKVIRPPLNFLALNLKLLYLVVPLWLSLAGCDKYKSVNMSGASSNIIHKEFYWSVLSKGDWLIASSVPLFSNSNNPARKLHYIMVVYDTKKGTNTISVLGGDIYKTQSRVFIKINKHQYLLPVYQDRAWLTQEDSVNAFIKDMLQADSMVVVNIFNNNTRAVDTYSLAGFESCTKYLMITPDWEDGNQEISTDNTALKQALKTASENNK